MRVNSYYDVACNFSLLYNSQLFVCVCVMSHGWVTLLIRHLLISLHDLISGDRLCYK